MASISLRRRALFLCFIPLFLSLPLETLARERMTEIIPRINLEDGRLPMDCAPGQKPVRGSAVAGLTGLHCEDIKLATGQDSQFFPPPSGVDDLPVFPAEIEAVRPAPAEPARESVFPQEGEKEEAEKMAPGDVRESVEEIVDEAEEKKTEPTEFEERWFEKEDFEGHGMELSGEKEDEKETLPVRFGLDFFSPARKKLVEMERRIIAGDLRLPGLGQRDALTGFVGPLEMVTSSVYADIPDRYLLSPNDRITISYWAKMLDFTRITLKVDRAGNVMVPKVGRMVARGMTLDQFQKNLKAALSRVTVKDLELIVTLDQLKSLQIFITGEAFRPGSYAVSAMTTLFNALYACGGPDENGSLRDIRLLRNGKTIRIDFYDYLLKGDSHNDIPLQPGDVIFISPFLKAVSVAGEVRRPGVYELRESENLSRAIELAQGIKATGIKQKVQIVSLIPNKERRLVDIVTGDDGRLPDHPLYDGDSINVYRLLSGIENRVVLEGKVERPGEYELTEGMRVSDLFSDMNRPLGEAYLERADLVRLNEDLVTTTLLPFNMKEALAGNPKHDMRLASRDRVIVYSKWEVEFKPPARVAVIGAVQRSGEYPRSVNMRVKDLLLNSGGVLPNAYLNRADLLRYDFEREITKIIPLDIRKVVAGNPESNVLLKDRDLLRVYTIKERTFTPPRRVRVVGAVQRPREYMRSDGMTVRDLLLKSGGVLPNAYLGRADLLRYDFEKEITRIVPVNIGSALSGEESADVELRDRDILRIFTLSESAFTPPHTLQIFGAIQRPGEYKRSSGMRIKDLLFAAGGVTPGHKNEIEIARASLEEEIKIFRLDYQKVFSGDEKENILLEDQDVVMIKKKTEFFDEPIFITVSGEVKYAGTYALKSRRERISDLIKRAGGFTDLAYPKGTVFRRERAHLVSDEQQRDINSSNEVVTLINDLEYERQLARNRFLWMKEQEPDKPLPLTSLGSAPVISSGSDASRAAAISMAPATSVAVGKTVEGVMDSIGDLPSVVSRARKMGERELVATDRVIIDMEKIVSGAGGEDDMLLISGDLITIPRRPAIVSVVGAVTRPTSISYRKSRKLSGYIALSGGFAGDADRDKVLVVSVDGSITPAGDRKHIDYGDIIYVPPRVMSLDIVERVDKVIEVVKFALATTASVVVFVVLIGLF